MVSIEITLDFIQIPEFFAPLLYSQFGQSAETNASQKQWIDLGDLSQFSCIVKPSTCGASGGSLSVWIKTGDCPVGNGILTSMRAFHKEGFIVFNPVGLLR